jgi:hypothetical protein
MFNNTLSGTIQVCHMQGSNVTGGAFTTVYNEHLLNTPWDGTGCTGRSDSSNISMTWATGNSQGYMKGSPGVTDSDTCANETTPCAPISLTNSTVGAGHNLTSSSTVADAVTTTWCATLASFSSEFAIGTEAANACKFGTTDGCTYITSNHTMSCSGQTAVARPATTAWDSGAYQYSASQSQTVQPPTALSVIVQ